MLLALRRLIVGAAVAFALGTGQAEASAIGLTSGNPGSLYTIDTSTGAATLLGNLTGAISNTSLIGLDFLGNTLYASDVTDGSTGFYFGRVDLTTGAFTALSHQDGEANWQSLAANQLGGFLYTVEVFTAARNLKTVTPAGVTTTIGPVGLPISALAYDDATGILYGSDGLNLYSINTTTAAPTLVGGFGVGCFRAGLDIDPTAGTLFLNGADCGGRLYTVNKLTGAATLVGANGATAGSGIDGFAIDTRTAAVPEPTTLALVGGALALARARRRR